MKNLLNRENLFFELAKKGKRISHIAIAIPMIFVLIIGGFALSDAFLFKTVLGNPQIAPLYKNFYQLTIGFSSMILLLWLWIRFFEGRKFFTIGFTKKDAFKKYIKGFLIGFLMLTAVIGLMAIGGYINFDVEKISFGTDILWIALIMLIGYIIQGASEEIIFRGWQMQVIGARYRPWLGVVISSVLFAILHGLNSGVSILAIINIVFFGILLALFVLRQNSLWAACGWHSAWNWGTASIYGLEVSGSEKLGSILNVSSSGPEYLSGGSFGPEASVITTLVLIIGIAILIFHNSKKS